jgi:hypothetical protein
MGRIFSGHGLNVRQLRDYGHISDGQSRNDYGLSEFGNVVLVGSSDFANDAVGMESFQESRHCTGAYFWNVFAQRLVLKPVDVEFATGQNFKKFEIILAEKIEPFVGTLVGFHGF